MTTNPDIPPPPWQRLPDRSSRRRREPISREAIVKAAIDLLDREGLPALSMRRLGDERGAGAASLYWHVGSKDGLLDLVLDEIIGEQQVPDPDPARWQEQLKEVARIMRRTQGRRSSSKNMCSVRQRPMPVAPKARATRASWGVSALARTFKRRSRSAQSRSLRKASTAAISSAWSASEIR